ncbi:MAG TPA: 5-oxoprolinase subunit PxpA [Vicinamibacterales bacterium]|nr:5-oxoprolinase subunit PxpA [Vicinamibacterales bacterium]
MRIDLNSDMGEGFGAYTIGADTDLLRVVSSANVACGAHAGDPSVMRRTVRAAKAAGVSVGAHPGFPDLAGFGRRNMRMTAAEIEDSVIYQVAALAGVAASEGVALAHVKPHGALYNMAAKDAGMAGAIASAIAAVDRRLAMVGLPASALERAAEQAGLTFAAEGFADRAYEADGTLVPRGTPGALITDPAAAAAGALRMAREGRVRTICIHSDTPGAAAIGAAVRRALDANGVTVAGLGA